MTPVVLIACIVFAASLGVGQMLFKVAATDIKGRIGDSLFAAALSPWLWVALVLYGLSTLLWIWILMQLPLNKAYPFALLGAAIVPLLAVFALGEHTSPNYPLGMLLVIAGVAVIQLT